MRINFSDSVVNRFMELSAGVRKTEGVAMMMPDFVLPNGMHIPTTLYQCNRGETTPEDEDAFIEFMMDKANNPFSRDLSFDDAYLVNYISLRLSAIVDAIPDAQQFVNNGPLSPITMFYTLKGHVSEYPVKNVWDDPYLSNVKIPTRPVKQNKYSYVNSPLSPLQAFQCGPMTQNADNPGIVVPAIGYSRNELVFPGIYSPDYNLVCSDVVPRYMSMLKPYIDSAFGRVLCFNPCLGYFAYMASRKENVESVTIVCGDSDEADFFVNNVLPYFGRDARNKIAVLDGDQLEYLDGLDDGQYDYILCDVWDNLCDTDDYLVSRYVLDKFVMTKVDVWLEETFLTCLLTYIDYIFQEKILNVPFEQMDHPDVLSKMRFLEEGLGDAQVKTPKDLDNIYRFDTILKCIKGRQYKAPETR